MSFSRLPIRFQRTFSVFSKGFPTTSRTYVHAEVSSRRGVAAVSFSSTFHSALLQRSSLRAGSSSIQHQQCRGLVSVIENSSKRSTRRPGLRTRFRRFWAFCFGNGRKGALVSPRQAAFLGNGSFILVTLSFLSTDILTLRALNVAAGALMFAFNLTAMERPMLISMRWGALLGFINIVQIIKLMRERRVDILPSRERDAYSQFFETGCLLSESQFWRLSDAGEWQTLHTGSRVTIEGAPNEYVYLILSGQVRVHRKGTSDTSTTLGILESGSWIGERGYLRQFALPAFEARDNLTAPSFATVTVLSKEAKFLRWNRADLQHEMSKSASINAGILLSMTRDVVRKLRVQSEQRSEEGLAELAAAGIDGGMAGKAAVVREGRGEGGVSRKAWAVVSYVVRKLEDVYRESATYWPGGGENWRGEDSSESKSTTEIAKERHR